MAGPVRHMIDLPKLERYLSTHAPEIALPLTIHQFTFGQSNPTYLLTSQRTHRRYVLRKKPPGQLLSKTAHKVEREFRVISALSESKSNVPVPRPLCLCTDEDVMGTPFYVMEFLDGRVIQDPAMVADDENDHDDKSGARILIRPDERTALWRTAVTTLARLHRVDVESVGLGDFGGGGRAVSASTHTDATAGSFYSRQLATWNKICAAQASTRDVETDEPVGPLPHMDELVSYFSDEARRPRVRETLVHGDYKIDNLVFSKPGTTDILGVLDWEMSTIGHPLSDLANLVHPFTMAQVVAAASSSSPSSSHKGNSDPSSGSNKSASSSSLKDQSHSSDAMITPPPILSSSAAFLPGATPGLPPLQTILSWYAETAGWDPQPELGWATAFTMFRTAAVAQGIAARVARRQASSDQAKQYAASRGVVAKYAWRLVRAEMEKESGAEEGQEGRSKL